MRLSCGMHIVVAQMLAGILHEVGLTGSYTPLVVLYTHMLARGHVFQGCTFLGVTPRGVWVTM